MPTYQEGDVVYALKKLSDPPSGDSPGCHLCDWGDKLLVKGYGAFDPKQIAVHHEHITDGRAFYVSAREISRMKPFLHNKPLSNGELYGDLYVER